MNMTKAICGLLLTSALGVGCKPRVRTIPDAVAEKNPDGTTMVTHRRLGVELAAPENTKVVGQTTPTEMELSWGSSTYGNSLQYLTVKAPDQVTPMTTEDLKVDLELSGSSVRILESKETEGGGFTMTFTYRNKKFDQVAGYYAVKAIGDKKVVCTYTGSTVRVAQGICESIKPSEAALGSKPVEAAKSAAEAKPTEEAKPALKKTTAELETEMAPPNKLVDVRPLFGTDPDVALPAIFAKTKKGMTAKELDAELPGVGAVKAEYATFTKRGKRWVRVKGADAHKELVSLEYDDKGGLEKISYMFDPASSSPALWDYVRAAAVLRFSQTGALAQSDKTIDLHETVTFPVKDVQKFNFSYSGPTSADIWIHITF